MTDFLATVAWPGAATILSLYGLCRLLTLAADYLTGRGTRGPQD